MLIAVPLFLSFTQKYLKHEESHLFDNPEKNAIVLLDYLMAKKVRCFSTFENPVYTLGGMFLMHVKTCNQLSCKCRDTLEDIKDKREEKKDRMNTIRAAQNPTISKDNLLKKYSKSYEQKVIKLFTDYYFHAAIMKVEDEYTKTKILLIWELLEKNYTLSKVIGFTKILEDKGQSLSQRLEITQLRRQVSLNIDKFYFYKDIYYPKKGVENNKDAGIASVTSRGVNIYSAIEYKKSLEDLHELSKKFINFN